MAVINPFILANRDGIPRLEATGVTVGTSNVTYSFRPHRFLNFPFIGLILFKLPAYNPPATAVPIIFNTNGKQLPLVKSGGVPVTSTNLNRDGVFLAFFDGSTLLLLTNI